MPEKAWHNRVELRAVAEAKIVDEQADRWRHRIRGYHLRQRPRYSCWRLPVAGHRQRYRGSFVSEARNKAQHGELVHGIRSVVGFERVSHFHKILADHAEYDASIGSDERKQSAWYRGPGNLPCGLLNLTVAEQRANCIPDIFQNARMGGEVTINKGNHRCAAQFPDFLANSSNLTWRVRLACLRQHEHFRSRSIESGCHIFPI